MKKSRYIVLLIGIIILLTYFDLFSRHNFITAYFDIYTTGLVYPQCEFDGEDLKELDSLSSDMGFKVRHVDCNLFYGKGMNQYYEIMSSKIETKNGQNWLDDLYEKREN